MHDFTSLVDSFRIVLGSISLPRSGLWRPERKDLLQLVRRLHVNTFADKEILPVLGSFSEKKTTISVSARLRSFTTISAHNSKRPLIAKHPR